MHIIRATTYLAKLIKLGCDFRMVKNRLSWVSGPLCWSIAQELVHINLISPNGFTQPYYMIGLDNVDHSLCVCLCFCVSACVCEGSGRSNKALGELIDDPAACFPSCCAAPGREKTHFSACRMRLTVPSFRSKMSGVFQFLELGPINITHTHTHRKICEHIDI